jgi:hypothetical protein
MTRLFVVALLIASTVTRSFAASGSCSRTGPPHAVLNPSIQTASSLLRQYLDVRLDGAAWDVYSRFITWTDEPGWDEYRPVSGYRMGDPVERGGKVYIPVSFATLGVWYSTPEFKPQPHIETVTYELVQTKNGWKVNRPDDLFPHECADKFSFADILTTGRLYDQRISATERKKYERMEKELRDAKMKGDTLLRRSGPKRGRH